MSHQLTFKSFLLRITISLMLPLAFNMVSTTMMILSRGVPRKYANFTHSLSANLNSAPTVELKPLSRERSHSQEHFSLFQKSAKCLWKKICIQAPSLRFWPGRAIDSWRVGNGPFRHCYGKVDLSSFYTSCVTDLNLCSVLWCALSHPCGRLSSCLLTPARPHVMPGGVQDSAESINVLPCSAVQVN